MKTFERAKIIKQNCERIIGARYRILWDLTYSCFRVLRASAGVPDKMVIKEDCF